MSNYLIELSIIHVAFILGYWFVLRKERQYMRMRFYLVGSTLLALVIPLLKLPKLFFENQEAMAVVRMEAMPLDAITIAPAGDLSTLSYDLFVGIYATISAFFLFKFLTGIFYLIHLRRKSSHELVHGLRIRRVANIKGSFTFFNWIFLSDEIDPNEHDYEMILQHEKAHASMGHTYDIVFFELFRVFFWWLLTAWFIIREIKKIHEYQADAAAIKSCDVDQYSSILISSTLKTNGLTLASSFHDGLILKRLTAMKQQAKKISVWKLAALALLCASLIIAFACSEERNDDAPVTSQAQGEVFTIVEAQPEFSGGLKAFHEYIMKEVKYPLKARQMGIEGNVEVQFVVGKDGSVTDVEVVKGISAECDSEAVRVVRSIPPFKPATQNGKPVNVRMIVPIAFKLNNEKVNPDNSKQGMVIIKDLQSVNEKLKVDAEYSNGEWSGTVYDEDGNPLPGVNIIVAGTTTGTRSGINGTFKVKADQSQAIHLSFVGYESVKVENGKGSVKISDQ